MVVSLTDGRETGELICLDYSQVANDAAFDLTSSR